VRSAALGRLALRAGPAAAPVAVRAAAWAAPVLEFGRTFKGPQEAPAGLRYWPDFVTPAEEAELQRVVDGEGSAWVRHIRRAQQFFGLVYYQTSQSVPALQPTAESDQRTQRGRALQDLPAWLLRRVLDTGVFESGAGTVNQVQANEYLDASGIGVHVEDPAAGPSLATLSLREPVQMTLSRAVDGRPQPRDTRDREDYVKILLEPRSLLVMQGESRYGFAHAIRQSRLVPLRGGEVFRRGRDYRRVSLTFRGILEDERTAERQDMPEGYVPFTLPPP